MEGKKFKGDTDIPIELYEYREYYYAPWELTFRLRDMSGIDSASLSKMQLKIVDKKVSFEFIDPAYRIVRCLVDEEGKRIYSDGDWEKISSWPSKLVTKLNLIIAELCGETPEESGNLEKN